MTKSFKASLIALAIASLPMSAQAAGLGQINVFSGLGQPLRAEIQVSATPQELQSLSARIASADAFRQANLTFTAAVSAIRVSVDTQSARPVIRLSSDRPINDPFLDLLVELNWASGRLVREYTFLLDPVDIAAPRPLAAAVDTPAAAPMARAPAAAPAARQVPAAARALPETYTVRRGDTLNRIASANLQGGAALDQMLVAIYRANAAAFDGGNINRLRAGAVLSMPDAGAVRAVDLAEARREIRAQAADFDAYRRGLATAAATRAPAPVPAAAQESAGTIVPRVEEPVRVEDAGDQVRVSRSDATDPGAETRLQALEEELISREKALEEANERLAKLETSIRDLQKLLELQSGSMAALQQQATPASAAEPVADAASGSEESARAAAESAPPSATERAAPAIEAAEKPVVSEPAPAPRPRPRPAPTPEPEPEPDLLETLMSNPTVLAGGGGVLLLLLALLALKARQRKKAATVDAADAQLDAGLGGDSQGVFGATGGQSVDTGATSILHTDFSQSGLSAIDTDEGVDPVAEADVYMAYGRDAQAEEILQDALKADPGRAAIYLKLLEVYLQRKSVRQFETVATELFSRTGGQGHDWDKAAAMGRKLDPENPLYGSHVAPEDSFAPRTESPPLTAVPTSQAPATAATVTAATAAAALGGAALAAAGERAPAPASPVASDEPKEAETPADPAHELSALDFTTTGAIEPSMSQMRDTWTVPGDLSKYSADQLEDVSAAAQLAGQAEPEAAGQAPAIEQAAGIEFELDPGVIDFDLDLDELADEVAEGGQAPVADATGPDALFAADDDGGLVFDLDVGEESAPATVPERTQRVAEESAQSGSEATMVDDIGQLGAALDFELPDLDLDGPVSQPFDMNATVIEPDMDAAFVKDVQPTDARRVDADVPGADERTAEGAGLDEPVVDLEQTSFDSSLLDFDFDIDTPMTDTPAPAAAAGLDLTSIDLDLDGFDVPDGSSVSSSAPLAAAASPGELESADFGADDLGGSEEVDTKLELARAYDEMGDKEGALELLEEVLGEGSPAQQAAAREMMARLG